ncbi:MAG: RluA family pseudouridine synthase [Clostridia bacterium]|nr:RluA family pseudouridine synthase [Clostridia bacterium]
MERKDINVTKSKRLLVILTDAGFSYNYASKMLRNKDVRVNGFKTTENITVEVGDIVSCFYSQEANSKKYKIIFEDENIYVIEKYAGIETEGKDGLEGEIKGAIAVHRLDRNTQGLLVMAKNKLSENSLLEAFKNHAITKKYIAEVIGQTDFKGETFKAFLQKDKTTAKVKVFGNYVKGSTEIKTIFRTVKKGIQTSLVEATLLTGKTHQIRSHLAFLGHAIIGDGKYGKNQDNKKFKEKTQKLYCFYLRLDGLDSPLNYLNKKEFVNYPSWYKKH